MITASNNLWRYVGPPRTGSTYLHWLLQRPPYNGLYSGHQHDSEPLEGAKLLVSVRDPFTRMLSLWKHRRYERGTQRGQVAADGTVTPLTDIQYPFGQYLDELYRLEDFYKLTVCDWLRPLGQAPLTVIHQERLLDDLAFALPALAGPAEPAPLIVVNASSAAKVQHDPYQDPTIRAFVIGHSGEDFERFQYPRLPL